VLAGDCAVADVPQTAGAPKDEAAPAVDAKVAKASFKLPPGFYQKKHGKHMLYCKKDAALGTRLKSERCFDERQIHDYLLALQEQKSNIDRIRSTCSSLEACGGG
jgi:hypothetical protein